MEEEKLPQVLQYNADFSGCGYWRLLWPQLLLNMKRKANVVNTQFFSRDFLQYSGIDVVHLQRQAYVAHYKFFKKLVEVKKRLNFRMVYEVDDIIFREDLPDYNFCKKHFIPDEVRESSQAIMEMCDEMTVTTPFLREYYLKNTNQKNISVIPNYPPLFWIGEFYSEELLLRNYRRNKDRPRILFAGGPSHFQLSEKGGDGIDDFTHVVAAIKATVKEFKWVFVGGFPLALKQELMDGEIEVHQFQTLDVFPRMLSMLGIQMAYAPLVDSDFNRAKSDLKYLEACALGLPIACQDMITYPIAPIRFKTGEELIQCVRDTLSREEVYIHASRSARRAAEARWLDRPEHYGKYEDLYTYPYRDPRRKHLK